MYKNILLKRNQSLYVKHTLNEEGSTNTKLDVD